MSKVFEIIEQQQKGRENTPAFMIGEQLKEIAAREPASAELLEKDLIVAGMGLDGAAKKLQEYADANHKTAKCFCITPIKAEEILREFYGLPKRAGMPTETLAEKVEASNPGHIDLSDFL